LESGQFFIAKAQNAKEIQRASLRPLRSLRLGDKKAVESTPSFIAAAVTGGVPSNSGFSSALGGRHHTVNRGDSDQRIHRERGPRNGSKNCCNPVEIEYADKTAVDTATIIGTGAIQSIAFKRKWLLSPTQSVCQLL
jgi:hypothetical protein